jgi:hypothetical protein
MPQKSARKTSPVAGFAVQPMKIRIKVFEFPLLALLRHADGFGQRPLSGGKPDVDDVGQTDANDQFTILANARSYRVCGAPRRHYAA